MKALSRLGVVLAGLIVSFGALAQAGFVEAVQMPAWIERTEAGAPARRLPLEPGMELKSGDRLLTGAGSRLILKLAEGSLMKLGQNGELRLTSLEPAKELFKGVMTVAQGAFRFTTDKLVRNPPRDINIHVSQVIAGVRGTDLWGRSRDDDQIVCLIEGRIEVGAAGEQAATLEQPLQFYQREKGQTRPIAVVEPKQLAEWAKETDIQAGSGATRRGGKWRLVLASAEDQSAALSVYDQLRAAGYAAQIFPVKDGEQYIYQVRIRNLPSRAEAQALGAQLRGKYGATEARVSR